jgi:hypothetical protein
MRALIFTLLLWGCFNLSYAQNKTLGVGTPTPNPNAVLHVESPTGNQGFIMPRLTTAQRTAMASLPLTASEEGMMVYDKDQKKIYIWSGSAWSLPAKYTVTDANSVDTALTAVTYSNKPHAFAVSGINKGTGDAAGFFLIDNVTSSAPALYAEQRGTGPAIMGGKWATNGNAGTFINGNNTNNAAALYAESNSNTANANTFASVMTGTGGNAASFGINNAGNTNVAVYSATSGTGAAIMGETATGFASVFGKHNGAGAAGNFQTSNSANPNATLWVQSNSTVAPAIQINHTGAGNAINANRPIQATQFIGDGSLLTNLPGGGGSGWALTGNSGTTPPTNFLGTTDNNDLLFRTNNTDRFIIGKNGGLKVPSGDIDMSVGKTMGIGAASDFFASPAGNFGRYALGWASDPWQGSGATAYLSGWGGMKMFTGDVSRFAINVFGQVGINNDNPAAQLDVNGDMLLQPIAAPGVVTHKLYNVGGSLYWNGSNISTGGGSGWGLSGNSGTTPPTNFLGTTDNSDLLFRTNNTDRFIINKGGGVTVPSGDINMSGGKAIGLSPSSDFFTSPVGNFGNYGLGWVLDPWQGSGATAYLTGWGGIKMFTFATGTSRFAINTFGLVGINNDNPAAQLDINGDVLLQPIAAPGVVTHKLYNVGGSLYWNGANISSGGGGGWGLTGNTLSGTETIGSDNPQPLKFETNNIERMRIDANGKVGIGTAPAYPLDVAGTTQIINTNPGVRAMEITNTVGDAVNITANGNVNTKAITANASATGNYATGVFTQATADAGQISMGVQSTALGSGTINYGVQANATGPANTNYGVYGSAFNASTANWAGYFDNGNVHIKNALSFGLTDGFYGTPGQILKSQGGASAPVWSDLYPQTTNISNGATLLDLTNGSGGMAASFASANGSQTLYVNNSGSGRAGQFTGSGNGNATLQAQNSGAGGTALVLFQSSNGFALDVQQGGIVYTSTITVSTTGSFGRAVIYNVTGSGPTISLTFTPQAGESVYVYAPNGATFDGVSLTPSSTAIYNLLYVAGGWRRVQ